MRETLSKITLKSLMVCTIHSIWEQQLHTQPLWWIEQLKIIFRKTSKQERIRENGRLLTYLSHRIIYKHTVANCSLHPGVFQGIESTWKQ
jgi:hypothetical protein